MAPTISSWFYTYPESTAHVMAERVRLILWDAGLFELWLDVVRFESPYKVEGSYKGDNVDLEWIPGKWLRLRSRSRTEDPAYADRLAHMLGLKPSWRYGDAEGYVVWEWRIGESEVRWREISGNPIYHHPERLSQD